MKFDEWFLEMKSNDLWWDRVSVMYAKKNLTSIANETYTFLLGKPERFAAQNFADFRTCFFNFAKNAKDEAVRPQLQQVKEEPKDEGWKPVSWEKRAEYLKQVQAEISKIDDKRIRPLLRGDAEENGQEDRPKPKAKCHPPAPPEVVVEHINKVQAARRKFFLERKPGASEEEIQAYINKFENI